MPAYSRGDVYKWPEGRRAALTRDEAFQITDEITGRGFASTDVYAPNDPDIWGRDAGTWRERVVYDPRNIRSRFARFDPRLSHLANLSAGVAGVGVAGALATEREDGWEQAREYLRGLGLLD